MHYGDFEFTRNGRPTHVTIPQGIGIGQRAGFLPPTSTACTGSTAPRLQR